MDHLAYQRPREKLRDNGASFLTSTELIQIIIGSGSSKASGARLSRRLMRALERNEAGYTHLIALEGIGPAKACQLLAALELGKRYDQRVGLSLKDNTISIDALFALLRSSKKALFACNWYDGSKKLLNSKVYIFKKDEHYGVTVRAAFVDGLTLGARSVSIALSSQSDLQPSPQKLGIVHALKGVASLLGMRINELYGVSSARYSDWSKEL